MHAHDRAATAVPAGVTGWANRLAILSLIAFASLMFAGHSLAGVTPHFVVSSTAAGPAQTVTIEASRVKADDQVGRIQIYVPTGFELNSPAGGVSVGTASAKVIVRDIDQNAEVGLDGTVVAISPSDPAVSYEGTNCDPNQHLAAWMVHLKSSKGLFSFPVFIDGTTGTSASFGPYILVACFRPWNVAAADPTRSPNGDVVDSLTLDLNPFTRPTADGQYRWRSLWTPFSPSGGALNTSANAEAQSIVVIPSGQIVIFGKKSTVTVKKKKLVRLQITGQVRVGGQPVGSVQVAIRHGSTKTALVSLGAVTAGADGGFTKLVTLVEKKQYYEASANVPAKDLGAAGCTASFGATPCIDATSGAGRTVSGIMLIRR